MPSTSSPFLSQDVCGRSQSFPLASLCFFGGWAEKKVSLPGPTGEANFANLMSFLSVPTGNPHAPGKYSRLQKEPEKRGPVGPVCRKEGCKHPLEVMMQKEHAQMPFKAMKETPKQSTFVLTGPLAPAGGLRETGAQPEQVLEKFLLRLVSM